ncbi:MAG TPA: NBR1-Ig-like domain-containing protein [Anaerolineales bacterium]|nr:NBR1-Ig-like domain-containing protein [Anaerolineales bacterium]
MSPSLKKILPTAIAMIYLLSACFPAQPTVNPADVQNQVATSVALTIAAQNAQTQAAASLVPQVTNTTLPTQTEVAVASPTLIIPTVTAVVLPTSSGGGGGGTVVKKDYACDSARRRPFDNTIFKPDDTFDIKWTIINTGRKTMQAGLDLKYDDGTQLTKTTRVELPRLEPGDEYTVVFDAVAPHKEGTYIMTFLVEGGLCFPYTAIVVQKP